MRMRSGAPAAGSASTTINMTSGMAPETAQVTTTRTSTEELQCMVAPSTRATTGMVGRISRSTMRKVTAADSKAPRVNSAAVTAVLLCGVNWENIEVAMITPGIHSASALAVIAIGSRRTLRASSGVGLRASLSHRK
ncbi:Uncharacterised protein [Mycobacteroides abscessus subsp. abscessus]|nr:Uncharacterised protein [Mycobacteroides abscessus subsp. abscessus]